MVTFTHEDPREYAKLKLTGLYLFAARIIGEKIEPYKDLISCIVDFGCGTGKSTRACSFFVNEGTRIVGIDLSPQMIDEAKRKTTAITHELPNVSFNFLTLQNNSIPLPDGSADCVVITLVFQEIHSQDDLFKTVSEISRITKQGSPFIALCVNDMITCEDFHTYTYSPFVQNRFATDDFRKCRSTEGGMVWEKDKHWSKEVLTELIERAGFEISSVDYPIADKSFPPYPEDPSIPWKDELHTSPFLVIGSVKG